MKTPGRGFLTFNNRVQRIREARNAESRPTRSHFWSSLPFRPLQAFHTTDKRGERE